MARYFGVPFATSGDKIVIPDAVQPDGSVNFSTGFGFDYQRPNTDPGYKPVPRDGMNGLFHDITEALGDMQRQGVADWTADAAPYPINAMVRHSDKVWRSLIANNSATPVEGVGWTEVDANNVRISGDQTINGIKTFLQSPVVPTPANADDSANKGYVDGALEPISSSIASLDADKLDKAAAFGVGQTRQNVTSSRVLGVTYTNSTPKAIEVTVCLNVQPSTTVTYNVDGSGDVVVLATSPSAAFTATVTFTVLSGGTYKITGGIVQNWFETRA